MGDPIAAAFRKIIEEIYWVDDLKEAEEILEKYLKNMDEDLREVLLERRREICNGNDAVINLIKLDALAEAAEEDQVRDALTLRSMIDTLFLSQCTQKWSELDPKQKAWILAPLYRASYGLELAMKKWPESVDSVHLENVEKNLNIAFERARSISVIKELTEFLDKKAKEVFGELGLSGQDLEPN